MDHKTAMNFQGKIGYNVARAKSEREEDILETLYQWYCEDEELTMEKVRQKFQLSKKDFIYYTQQMEKHGYLETIDEDGELYLTDFGKVQGAECLHRHRYLTQFFRMIGLDEANAEEDACRLEHVISEEAIAGICNFLNFGDTYDRVIQDANLNCIYEAGDYEFGMGIYRMGVRYPRILAEEFYEYGDQIRLSVRPDQSYFIIETKEEPTKDLWYRTKDKWKLAVWTEKGFQIPTEVFSITMNVGSPISEGDAVIAFTERGKEPKEKQYLELNVHIW